MYVSQGGFEAGDRWAPHQSEQLEFVPYGQKLQNIHSRTIEREDWALPKKKIRDPHVLLLEIRRPPDHTGAQRLHGDQRGVMLSDANYP